MTEKEDDYFGLPVIEASRLCAAAAGGEVLVADIVRALVRTDAAPRLIRPRQLTLKGLDDEVCAWELATAPEQLDETLLPTPLRGDDRFAFVGRDDERERLSDVWKWADSGEHQLVLVSGEPGVGKTRLAAEMAAAVRTGRALVLYGRCDPELAVPYQPFAEALRTFVDQYRTPAVARRLGRYRGELVRLVPDLADRVRGLPPAAHADPETERFRLFEAVTFWLAAASVDEPILLVLDDLHWAARPTLQLLRHVITASEPMRLMIIGTYRDTEAGADTPLGELLPQFRDGSLHHVALTGFDEATTVRFLEAAAGHEMSEKGRQLAQRLHELTHGNAFFARELVLHLADVGGIAQLDGRWDTTADLDLVAIPSGVRRVVEQRLNRLSPGAQDALRWSAIIGLQVDVALLTAVSDLEEDELLQSLEECVAARLLDEGELDRFYFTHALVRSTLYSSLATTRRASLHRRVGAALEAAEAAGRPNLLAELAHHFDQSGRPADQAKALGYARQAGERAMTQLAHDEAARSYRRALELLDKGLADPSAELGLRCDLLTALGEALHRAGDPAYRTVLAEAASEAEALGDAARLGAALLAADRGTTSIAGAVDPGRVAMLERALSLIGTADSPLRARLTAALGVELHFAGDPERCRTLAEQSIAIARGLDDRETLAHVLVQRAAAIRMPDMLEERLAVTRELERVSREIGDPLSEFFAAYRFADAALEAADLAGFDEAVTKAERLAVELRQPAFKGNVARLRTERALLRGDLKAAEEALEQMRAVAEDLGLFSARVTAYTGLLAKIRSAQGRPDETVAWWSEIARFEEVAGFKLGLAIALADTGFLDGARELYEPFARDGFAGVAKDLTWLETLCFCATLAVRFGDARAAGILHELLEPYASRVAEAGVGALGSVAHFLGLLSTVQGRYHEAELEFAHADAINVSLGAPLLKATTDLALADLLLAREGPGDRLRAGEIGKDVAEVAREHRAAGIEHTAEAILQRSGE